MKLNIKVNRKKNLIFAVVASLPLWTPCNIERNFPSYFHICVCVEKQKKVDALQLYFSIKLNRACNIQFSLNPLYPPLHGVSFAILQEKDWVEMVLKSLRVDGKIFTHKSQCFWQEFLFFYLILMVYWC